MTMVSAIKNLHCIGSTACKSQPSFLRINIQFKVFNDLRSLVECSQNHKVTNNEVARENEGNWKDQ